MRSLVSISRY